MGYKKISGTPDKAIHYLKKTIGSMGIALSIAKSEIKGSAAQTWTGYLLNLFQILMGTAMYWLIFGIIFKVDTYDIPYPIFLLPGLISWQYFAGLINEGGNALITNQHLISKIYFPRVLLVMGKVLPGLLDFGIAILLTLILIILFGIPLKLTILLAPIFIVLLIVSGFSIGLWIASISVKYRDFSRLIPYLINFGFFMTPVFYPATIVPENLEFILYINPVAFAVEGLRYSMLGTEMPGAGYLLGLIPVGILLFWAWNNVRRKEKMYADIL
jgi:lipopolysaccharide transport system permease protein